MASTFIPVLRLPGWSIGLDITHITYKETKLSIPIQGRGNITLVGNVHDAALGLIEHLNAIENKSISSITFNSLLEIDLENNQLLYHGKEPSQMILDLIQEFNKMAKLKAFW